MSQVPPPPFATDLLAVDEATAIYWEMSGNPDGRPALYLHGGPGSSLGSGRYRALFDPRDYCLVGIDQRGCGRSRPLACDRPGDLRHNTTQALIADIEAVRNHLHIENWLVAGMSWGSTLALAYAQAHPKRVRELVLAAVTTTSRAEVDWITEGISRLLPEACLRFDHASKRRHGERPVEAYARRMASDDPQDRVRAATAWNDWEAALQSLEPGGVATDRRRDEREAMTFAMLVAHYWSNDGFLRDGREIASHLGTIAHLPAVLICGRRDIGSPAITAWKLHHSWPGSRLIIIEEEGHGGPMAREEMRQAIAAFARR
jgi:proline iminopeptidase